MRYIHYIINLYKNKMENIENSLSGMYEVEKIINCKIYKNKKFYLIKWLCFPIHESTWEPKSSLKNLNYMIDSFEAKYPFSVDQYMYEIYCEELKKRTKRRNKRKNNSNGIQTNTKFLQKKKKMEFFSVSELKDKYFDKLKEHLHLNMVKRHNKDKERELVIEISSSIEESEENEIKNEINKEYFNVTEEKNNYLKLIMPQME